MNGTSGELPDRLRAELESGAIAGRILLIGGTDSGKSTLARCLAGVLAKVRPERAGWIDGDIGQSVIGLPTTVSLALLAGPSSLKPPRPQASFFAGSTNATRCPMAILTGLKRLQEEAEGLGADTLAIDTTGFVDRTAGGLTLKEWKVELLRPHTVIALQVGRELEPVVAPLRKHPATRVVDQPVDPGTSRKSAAQRRKYRREKLRAHFGRARHIRFRIPELPVYGLAQARKLSLVGLLDGRGLCLSLGVIRERRERELEIFAPLEDTARVAAVRVSELCVDPETGVEIA
jgi:polynucleotide 5'-hydroxyl-kinase GRC3/NOL9